MRSSRDLLSLFLLVAVPLAARPVHPPAMGPPAPIDACPVVVEAAGAGVGCLSVAEGARARLRSGDRLRLFGELVVRERMAPARFALWRLPIDLNHAGLGELASLDGIGPRLAERIVAARPFVTVEDLARVRGFGGARLDRLRERLLVGVDP